MTRPVNEERLMYFAGEVQESLRRVVRRMSRGKHDAMLRLDAAQLRDRARLVAYFAGAREPDLLPEETVRRVLAFAAEWLVSEGGYLAAASDLRSEEADLAARRALCGEEPAGL